MNYLDTEGRRPVIPPGLQRLDFDKRTPEGQDICLNLISGGPRRARTDSEKSLLFVQAQLILIGRQNSQAVRRFYGPVDGQAQGFFAQETDDV